MTDIIETYRADRLARELAETQANLAMRNSDLEEAIDTVRKWHGAALKMRDLALDKNFEAVDHLYIETALMLPFYGPVLDAPKLRPSSPPPSERAAVDK